MNLYKKYLDIIQEKINPSLFKTIPKIKEKKIVSSNLLNHEKANEFQDALNDDNTKILITIIGPPASGKSTLIKSIKRIFNNDVLLIDRDKILSDNAKDQGLNFDDLFIFPRDNDVKKDHPKYGKWIQHSNFIFGVWEKTHSANINAQKQLQEEIKNSVNTDKKVIIVDNININIQQRDKLLKNFIDSNDKKFYKIAIVISKDLIYRKDKNIKNKKMATLRTLKSYEGKNPITVTPKVVEKAIYAFQYPTEHEGYNLILNVDNVSRIFNKLLKRKINIDELIENTPLQKSFNNKTIQEFLYLINKTNFDKKLDFNVGFEEYFSDPNNFPQEIEKIKIIKKIQSMYPEIRKILIENGYPYDKPINVFLKQFKPFYYENFKNIIYFYENII